MIKDAAFAQALLEALSDEYSRKIILATIPRAMSTEEISKENSIPVSTCYRRIHSLIDNQLLLVEKTVSSGKMVETYRSAFKDAKISLEASHLNIDATPTRDSDKLQEMWSSVGERVATRKHSPGEGDGHFFFVSDAKSLDLVLADCDLCKETQVWCRTLHVGESKTSVFVCSACEAKRRERRLYGMSNQSHAQPQITKGSS